MGDALQLTVHEIGLNHAEGVTLGPDGLVYAGGETGELYRIDLAAGTVDEYANTGGCLLGLALDGDANLYACDLELHQVVRIAPDGSTATYTSGTRERPMRLPNYPVFDDDGSLYVSDSGDWGADDGLIYRVSPDGRTEVWNETASGFTNGMCLVADGQALYVAESAPPLISRVEIRADGTAGERTVLAELPRTVPDGLALDQDGNLLIALYNPNIIYRYAPTGALDVVVDDWEQQTLMTPTNIVYAGADLRTLVIANLGGRHLTTAPMDVAGLPLRYPKLQSHDH